jgi:hypothetical protein
VHVRLTDVPKPIGDFPVAIFDPTTRLMNKTFTLCIYLSFRGIRPRRVAAFTRLDPYERAPPEMRQLPMDNFARPTMTGRRTRDVGTGRRLTWQPRAFSSPSASGTG